VNTLWNPKEGPTCQGVKVVKGSSDSLMMNICMSIGRYIHTILGGYLNRPFPMSLGIWIVPCQWVPNLNPLLLGIVVFTD
jgi:hypothetical protein